MQKKQTKVEQDATSLFSQLQIGEIEGLLRKALSEFNHPNLEDKKDKISALLRSLNEDCMLPVVYFENLTILSLKKKTEELTPQELEEFSDLKKEEKKLQSKRINVIKKLAEIKEVSLQELGKELGFGK